MAQDIINPKDTTCIIQLNAVMEEIKTDVGFIKDSGLFAEHLTPRDAIIEQIKKQDKRGMLGFTGRRERNKVKNTKRKEVQFALQIPYQEQIDEITKEDIYQVAKSWDDATEENIMDLYADKLTVQREVIDNSHEFLCWTAAQGKTLNPEDGSVVLDMFAITDTTRPQVSLDLTDPTLDVLAWMGTFRNRVMRDNKRGSNQGTIEIFTTDAVFTKFVSHPSVLATFQQAYMGTGKAYLENVVSPYGTTKRGEYGIVREFEWNGVRLVVAPQTFILEDADDITDEYEAVKENEGFAVVRGIRDSFKALFGQNNSMTDPSLAKVYAYRSKIIDDAYFEITASSAPMAYTTAPELCYQFKFKTK